MKITIKNESNIINLRLPSSFIKSDLLLRYANVDKETRQFIKKSYKLLKKYAKENGHFDLVEVYSDSAQIIIRI